MRAARLHEYTDDMHDAFEIEEIPRPEIQSPNDVLVEIDGAGWCQTDNHIVEGMWTKYVDIDFPQTLGHENAGTIAEVGEDVTTVEPGDTVIVHPLDTCGECRACRQGKDTYCENSAFPGMNRDGGFAEYLRTSARSVVPLPDDVDPTTVAPHADAGITAYHTVKKAVGGLNPGDYAIVLGIGGLGHIGLQALDAMSAAKIIAIDVKEAALGLAETLGADHTIDSSSTDVGTAIEEITDGEGAQQAIDFVGRDDTLALTEDMLALGGDHHVAGYGGHLHETSQTLVHGEWAYRGSLIGQYTELQELMALVAQGDVELQTETYDLAEINDVAAMLEAGEIEGRAVLVP
ncbi:Zn-dependent alcohol dehydrogenase [Halanaeroarchaeum sp. HSR-CO]|uniref:NAD(P)-dependent alcohol dehydrogenase n=1 Tax=Halanaeroarchaeum sp. HSR-CO TaxID=2866382 RepID=UPI00217E31CA|nr:NAD(P)-dependent alcohol dehydrogenase [Halanaeroarchaeum sp. HSR-CO]UWG47081.1 Zn-dependent alcohol dehydrogenase [Halanaeroarchaeum sp. HSR-CO]